MPALDARNVRSVALLSSKTFELVDTVRQFSSVILKVLDGHSRDGPAAV
jgi:hypothetical protein